MTTQPKSSESKGLHNAILSCNHPHFIQHYFKQSRLHHLSTWKADLCEFVGDVMQNSQRIHRVSSTTDFPRVIMHVDMDCFFVSVGIRSRPELQLKPVAVAHSTNGLQVEFSSSEIASCNYPARAKGVKNGMFIGSAKKLAPDLVIIPYDFDSYDACSRTLYRILIENSDFVQAVSCDEAYVDLSHTVRQQLERENLLPCNQISERLSRRIEEIAREHAEQLRRDILRETGCNASVGISTNLLLARIATFSAKPNGCHFLTAKDSMGILRNLSIRDLPGVGWSTTEKCTQWHVSTCGELLQTVPLPTLQLELGEKTGQTLWDFCHGRDDRTLENKVRQTLGAEINWGIRFTTPAEIDIFLRRFCDEVYTRLHSSRWMAKHITVTAKKKLYEGEPGKFLGCGHCQDYSRSVQLPQFLRDIEELYKHVVGLFKEMALVPTDVRGVGIHLKKLQRRGPMKGKAGTLSSFFNATAAKSVAIQSTSSHPDGAAAAPPTLLIDCDRQAPASVTADLRKEEKLPPQDHSDAVPPCEEVLDFGGSDDDFTEFHSDDDLVLHHHRDTVLQAATDAGNEGSGGVEPIVVHEASPQVLDTTDVVDLCSSDDDDNIHAQGVPIAVRSTVSGTSSKDIKPKVPVGSKSIAEFFKTGSTAPITKPANKNASPVKRHYSDAMEELRNEVDLDILNSLPSPIREEQIEMLLGNVDKVKRRKLA